MIASTRLLVAKSSKSRLLIILNHNSSKLEDVIVVDEKERVANIWTSFYIGYKACECGAKCLVCKLHNSVDSIAYLKLCESCGETVFVETIPDEETWPTDSFDIRKLRVSELRVEDFELLTTAMSHGRGSKQARIRLFNALINLSLDQKIAFSKQAIMEALKLAVAMNKTSPTVMVGFSGGKDSTVLLHLAATTIRELKARTKKLKNVDEQTREAILTTKVYAVYESILEFPETEPFVIEFCKKLQVPLVIVKSKIDLVTLWEVFGMPQKKDANPVCRIIKKLAAYVALKYINANVIMTGVRAEENWSRKDMFLRQGLVSIIRSFASIKLREPLVAAQPLAIWKRNDVLDYIVAFGLPINEVYNRYVLERQGCAVCPLTENIRKNVERYKLILGEEATERLLKLLEKKYYQTEKLTARKIINKLRELGYIKELNDLFEIRVIEPPNKGTK